MRKLVYSVAAIAVSFAVLTGCKTTEENYQRAYEVAKAKKTEGLTQAEIAGLQREEAMPKTVFKGDSIPLKGMYVRRVDGGVNGVAMKYNVVVGSFKQDFNARSVFERMRNGGYADAVLLADRDGRYYIGAVTTASLDSAVEVLRRLDASSPVVLRSPFPYILQKP